MGSTTQAFWNIALVIAGAMLGVLLTVILDDPIRKRLQRLQRKFRARRGNLGEHVGFELGPLKPDCLIIEGDGTTAINEELVHITVKNELIELPREMTIWRDEIELEQNRLRDEGRKHKWNGKNFAVVRVSPVRRRDDEAPEIFIELRPSDYYSFLATQQLDRRFSDGTTPRIRYLEPFGPTDAPPFMSISLGASILAITTDNKILLRRRSKDVGSRPGFWGVSVDEGISKSIDSPGQTTPHLHNVARRALWEEMGLGEHEYRLTMLAITLDTERHQWDSVFVAYLHDISSATLRSRLTRGAPDDWEHDRNEFVNFDIANVLSHLLREDRINTWTPLAPVAIYLSLVYEYGKAQVESAVTRIAHKRHKGN